MRVGTRGRKVLRRSFIVAGLISTTAFVQSARAQTAFSTITIFGESYADRGNLSCFLKFGAGSPNCPYPRHVPFVNPPGPTNIAPFSYELQKLYGIPDSAAFDYAVGGNTSYRSIVGPYTDTVEVNTFIANGGRFGPKDLVAIEVMGNATLDSARVTQPLFGSTVFPNGGPTRPTAFNTGDPAVDATNEAGRELANVQKLISVGARNIVWMGTGNFTTKPIGESGPNATPAYQALFNVYAPTAFNAVQNGLAPYARSGAIRVFLFDTMTFEKRLNATPQVYGYSSVADAFLRDGLHYNPGGFLLIARYMQNQIDAPTTVSPQGDVAMSSATAFANAAFGRLDAYRTFEAFGPLMAGTPASYPFVTKAPPQSPPVAPRWSVYAEGNYATGTRSGGRLYGSSFDYNDGGGTLGLEYRYNPSLLLGLVFSFSQPTVNLQIQNDTIKINSYQFGGYASYNQANWFADGLLAYGLHTYDLSRQGIIDTIGANTTANTWVAAGKAGYLFDLNALRAGPIVGLNYTSASVKGYTETGDVLLTMMVNEQTVNSLTGSAGAQFRLPFLWKGGVYSPFVNVTAEHDFIGTARTITTTQVTTPVLPVLTPIDSYSRTYGKIAGGVAANVFGNVSAQVNAWSTFARATGNDLGVNAGVKVSF